MRGASVSGSIDGTIVALSSGAGKAGVAVVRLSGPQARAALLATVGEVPPPRSALLRSIRGRDDSVIDRGLVLFFPAPHSFTGEDCAEWQVHGGRAVTRAMIETLLAIPDVRLAEAGEFTRRAVAAGKLDLTQAEALADLIDSETERQRRAAMALFGGDLSRRVVRWRDSLIDIQASLAAAIDFPDEGDIPDDVTNGCRDGLMALAAGIEAVLAQEAGGRSLMNGFRVVLAGPPNAGKSSLLNALARRDVAIVTPVPGTTRDVLEVRLDLGGFVVIVSDTAGMRVTEDFIEREGIRRAEHAMMMAECVLWLDPLDAPTTMPQPPGSIRLRTKRDIVPADALPREQLCVSAVTGEGIGELEAVIVTLCEAEIGREDPLVLQERQAKALRSARDRMGVTLAEMAAGPDILSENVRRVIEALDRLTGRIGVEDVLDAVFGRFCIGK
jgi:tRNA modification GTPase